MICMMALPIAGFRITLLKPVSCPFVAQRERPQMTQISQIEEKSSICEIRDICGLFFLPFGLSYNTIHDGEGPQGGVGAVGQGED